MCKGHAPEGKSLGYYVAFLSPNSIGTRPISLCLGSGDVQRNGDGINPAEQPFVYEVQGHSWYPQS